MPTESSFSQDAPPPGYEYIFRPWKIDPKTGRVVYPKHARVFRMLVKKR